MVTTTAKAFDIFKAKVQLTNEQAGTVNARHATVAGYLRTAFPASSKTPVANVYLIGSAQRETIIRPVDDIDLMVTFSNRDSVFEQYRGNSQAFLYKVRDALNKHSTVKVVGARGQAVRFFYASGAHVDVAPMFKWSGDGYALPNGAGGWLTTDPLAHAAFMAQRHRELGYQFKGLVRMMKRWNNVHSKHFKSFHLEAMVSATFSSLGANSRTSSQMFFNWGQRQLDVLDPAGHGGNLSDYLTSARREAALGNMRSAYDRSCLAVAAENAGNHAEAIRHWRIIYGDDFPAYG